MPDPAYGYIRLPSPHSTAVPGEAEQRAFIEGYCARRGLQLDEVFLDEADVAGIPWLNRPAGGKLVQCLTAGCQVVVADGRLIYTSAADLLAVVRDFRQRNIVLHIVNVKNPCGHTNFSLSTLGIVGEVAETALEVMQSLKRSARSEAVREGMRKRKREGKKYARFAGYGFVWKGRKGHERREPHQYEQTVMHRILEWKQLGFSWYKIAAHLLRHGIHTAEGKEWSPARVRRACLAELRRRAGRPGDQAEG